MSARIIHLSNDDLREIDLLDEQFRPVSETIGGVRRRTKGQITPEVARERVVALLWKHNPKLAKIVERL